MPKLISDMTDTELENAIFSLQAGIRDHAPKEEKETKIRSTIPKTITKKKRPAWEEVLFPPEDKV